MTASDATPPGYDAEKGPTQVPDILPGYGGQNRSKDAAATVQDEPFMTRNGLNLTSFKKRDYGLGIVELDRAMSKRHLHMIAIGGSIGAGFFVGSGKALAAGGPGWVFIDFLIVGVMMFNVVYALGELAVMYPVSGGFYTYSTRFIDPSWGFAMGWNYVLQWAVVLPLELTVCGITISYWNEDISQAVWIVVFLVVITIFNIFGSLGYAEEEFVASIFKLSAIIIFMIIAFVLVLGGGPKDGRYNEYWGARYWYDPGAFKDGFQGFCSVFATAAFSFAGTELVGLAAAESKNPVKALPGAIKQIFWRVTLFYILGLFFVGLLVPHTDTSLLAAEGKSSNDPNTSPFVLAAKYAELHGLDHFMNFVILVSVLSISVSAVYGGSRCLTALAQQGYAPKIFTYIDRSGRPLPSVIIHLLFGLLGFMSMNDRGAVVFDWLLALSALAALFTWGSICAAHIRFRSAWKHNGHSVDEIPFQAVGGVYGSWCGLTLNIIVLAATFYNAIKDLDVETFFMNWICVPIILVFWIIGYLWKRTGWLTLDQIDVDTGRREIDWEEVNAYRAKVASWPKWRQTLNLVF
ncbi:probable Amino-acid permease inda1 [Cephalotrichum gorgonifer]|uniref:Probable Amino-acid permease inda1 n=1 Tax=Cephalotrichum gorgonifer TaxID=2041049 RepID=A0AAE8SXX7_9PEZI|nr:probable Amino-acid permease inda1 [Cephalotrichum gorgonifer]